jgi:transcriptional regulator with PAS, ATPase and Fis domain
VRVIAATNADPERGIAAGTFRRDLFYRLSVIQIHVPPLRDRPTDVPALCEHFLTMFRPGRRVRLADGERERLMGYHWPGNVRELRNVCERCVIVQDDDVLRPSALLGNASAGPPASRPASPLVPLSDIERAHITGVLSALDFNQTRAAGALGISISTLRRKLREYEREPYIQPKG